MMIGAQPVAHAQIHDHKVEFKDARIKTASGFLEGGGLIDAGDAFGRTTASKSNDAFLGLIY